MPMKKKKKTNSDFWSAKATKKEFQSLPMKNFTLADANQLVELWFHAKKYREPMSESNQILEKFSLDCAVKLQT